MDKVLQMTFNTEFGGKLNISLPNPKDGITDAEISTAMDTIIAQSIFTSANGKPVSKNAAEIITTTSQTVTL